MRIKLGTKCIKPSENNKHTFLNLLFIEVHQKVFFMSVTPRDLAKVKWEQLSCITSCPVGPYSNNIFKAGRGRMGWIRTAYLTYQKQIYDLKKSFQLNSGFPHLTVNQKTEWIGQWNKKGLNFGVMAAHYVCMYAHIHACILSIQYIVCAYMHIYVYIWVQLE